MTLAAGELTNLGADIDEAIPARHPARIEDDPFEHVREAVREHRSGQRAP